MISDDPAREEPRLPKSDWILLLLASVATIALIMGLSELLARRFYAISKTTLEKCLVLNDPVGGARAIPNSVCFYKTPEDRDLVEYKFNSCGYRAGMECGPKPAGVYRLVFVGSSMVFGYHAAQDQSFVGLMGDELSKDSHRRVEVYNEGMYWGFPGRVALHFPEIQSAQPDAIVWPITPFDVEHAFGLIFNETPAMPSKSGVSPAEIGTVFRQYFSEVGVEKSRFLFFLRHCLYKSRKQFLDNSLVPGAATDYLRSTPSPKWHGHLQNFETSFAEVAKRAKTLGIPLVVTVVPLRAQADMISMGEWPAGFDPYIFGEQVRTIVERHGGVYFDVLHEYQGRPSPDGDYLPVDGHPNEAGNLVFSQLIAKKLASGAIPELRGSGQQGQ